MKLDYDALADLADMLTPAEANEWRGKSQRLAQLVNTLLWRDAIADGEQINRLSGFYIALSWQHGVAGPVAAQREVIDTPNWASMLPLYAGISTQQQADVLIRHHMLNPRRYWSSSAGVRTMPADDPLFSQARRVLSYDLQEGKVTPVSNWCGPIWVLSNYYMFIALLNYGYKEQAQELAAVTAQLLLYNLDNTGCLYENYNDNRRGLWADHFCSWNVLSLTMLRQSGLFPDLTISA